MKVKGEPWRPFEQRAADALVSMRKKVTGGAATDADPAAGPSPSVLYRPVQ
jgi:hypothetical protein